MAEPTFDPAPLALEAVLDPAWLGCAQGGPRGPLDVRSVRIVDQFGPSATKVRMELDFGPAVPADTPTAYCLKGFFGDSALGYLESGVQITEAGFYRDCAPHLSMRLAPCAYTGTDPATGAGIIVMHDLIAAGARFLTALEPYSVDQAHSSLDQLARLHGESWGERLDAICPWAKSRVEELSRYERVPPARLTELMRGERGDPLPDALRDGDRIYAALRRLAQRDDAAGQCLVHGDAHAGNVFEHAADSSGGGCGIIDWQLLQRAHWSLDAAYHIAAVLTVADRRQHEQDLLRYYLERLAAHGGQPPHWDEAWARYCESVAYGMFLWGITLRVDPPIILEFNRRLGTAVADLDSFGRLGV